jgi:ABC-2 type transport system permease protein
MWFTIVKKEIRLARRNQLFIVLAAITWLLLIVACIGGYERYKQACRQQQAAGNMLRHEWEEQERNPHSAAHFGTWLFKPFTFLSLYDNGLNNFTGTSYRVEAHKQHEVSYSTVQDTDSQLRFGELSPALVFQLLVPLLIIILAHGAVSSEREQYTLRLVSVQGGNMRGLLWGKILGNYFIMLLTVLPALVVILFGAWLFKEPALLTRSLAFCGAYLVYFFIITALTVMVSAWCKRSTGALFVSLGAWVLCCILLPRIATWWADQASPLPSRYAFNRKIQEGYAKGLGSDGAVMDRRKRYEQQVLKQYKVDQVTKLPVNFSGLSMQYGEDYYSMVYQKVATETDSLIRRQQTLLETVAMFNPFMAIQQASMGVSGTDYFHHLDFHQQARLYRDEFIRRLNMELTNNGGAYGSSDYKAGPAYFKNTAPFHWRLPSAGNAIRWHLLSWVSLAGWLLITFLLMLITAKKMTY